MSKRIVVAQAWASAFLLLLWPLLNLWHPTQFRWHATVHALSAVGMVVFGSYAGHQAIYLLRGAASRLPTIRRLILWCVGLSALVVISGNWAYMPYRGVGGARQRLLDSAPFFQNVVMEFKEFICLLPLPLYIGAAFLLYYYGQQSARDQRVAAVIGVLLIAAWAFLMAGAVMGMSIAKVQFL
ncbi:MULTISPECIES: hypothetical protein [Burkholderia]|uniref:hypothetical protein n=1 Tax=Burkholderia TaxID=32008 RepID=UPI0008586918|nr:MULTISPECIES: hypothetical protein [unclassified Burkholderia]AOK28570.1 hypothetical protein AQ611_03130 [Burkholderia sp. Bp7605]